MEEGTSWPLIEEDDTAHTLNGILSQDQADLFLQVSPLDQKSLKINNDLKSIY